MELFSRNVHLLSGESAEFCQEPAFEQLFDTNFSYAWGYLTIGRSTRGTFNWSVHTPPDPICHDNSWPGGEACSIQELSCPVGYQHVYGVNGNPDRCVRIKPEACPAGNPIQCAGGQKIQTENDITSAGDEPLAFARYYSSGGFYTAAEVERPAEILGRHWRHSWQGSVTVEAAVSSNQQTYAYVMFPDGNYRHFRWDGSAWISRTDQSDSLQEVMSGGVRTGWIYVDERDAIYRYDANGIWQSVERNGRLTQLSYSDTSTPPTVAPRPGLLVSVTNSRGRSLHFNYDQDGYLVSVVNSDGNVFGFRYLMRDITGIPTRNEGLLLHADRPDGSSREYLYDESQYSSTLNYTGFLTGIVDEVGNHFATFKYDTLGMVIQEFHGLSGADSLSITYGSNYNAEHSRSTLVDGLGNVVRRKFVLSAGVLKDAGTDRCDDIDCQTVSASTSLAYDASGNLDQKVDANGTETDFDYNGRALETQRMEAANDSSPVNVSAKRTVQTDWHPTFRVRTEQRILNAGNTLEAKTQWRYNSRGQLIAKCQIGPMDASGYSCSATDAPAVNAKVRRWVTNYCEPSDIAAGTCPLVGLVTSVNGPRLTTDAGMGGGDDIATYTYRMADDPTCASSGACAYRKGDLWKVTNALGQVTEYVSYDKNGRVKRTKDANGTLTDFTYHARGWLTDRTVRANNLGTTDPGDATLHIDYDAVGNVTKVTQPDGAYLQYTYDDAHRLIKINDNLIGGLSNSIDYCPGGVGTSDCLDAAGNRKVELTKDPSNAIKRELHRVYNDLGQLTKVLNANGDPVEDSAGITGAGIADGYDGNGNRVYKDDGLGIRTEQDYDPLNRLKTTIQDLGGADAATTKYTYDTRDNLRTVVDPGTVTDPAGLATNYTYDGLDNLIALDSPDTGHAGYTYDAAGNRISQTDNRTPSVTSTYTYDRLNRLTSVTYPTTSLNVTYAYDQSNATTGCSTSFSFGRLTTMTDATGSTTYCYDRRGNVTKKKQVTSGTTLVTQYTYTTADRLATMTYPGGDLATYTRDVLGRITGISWTPSGSRTSTLVSSAAYLPFGPLTTLTFGNGRTLTKAYDQDYAIDSISGTPAGAFTLDIVEIDVMGNIKKVSGTMNPTTPDRVYDYDALYRLKTSQTGGSSPLEAYTYNKTGDRKSASLNGGAASAYTYITGTHHLASVGGVARTYDGNGNTLTGTSPGLTLTYDDRNRLASMVNGTTSATYAITGRGERVGKTVTVSGTPTATLFGYDEGGRLTGEYSGAGAVQAEYIYLDNVPVGVFKGGALYYIETDHLGTPRQVVKPTGNVVVWRWDFLQNTFGNSAPNQDPDGDSVQFVLGMRFPGQYSDMESMLSYNYSRNYDQQTGRYVESDPIGLLAGWNTYAYVSGNPVVAIDPMGLVHWDGVYNFTAGGISRSGVGGAAIGFTFVLKSRCEGGKKAFAVVDALAAVGGVGASIFGPISLGASTVSFEDSRSNPDPHVFDGDFSFGNIGTIFASLTNFAMGGAIGDGSGLNASTSIIDISSGRGRSSLRRGKVVNCCNEGGQ